MEDHDAIASIVLAAFSAAWAIGRTVGKFHFFICLQTYSVGIVYFSALTPIHGQIADRVF